MGIPFLHLAALGDTPTQESLQQRLRLPPGVRWWAGPKSGTGLAESSEAHTLLVVTTPLSRPVEQFASRFGIIQELFLCFEPAPEERAAWFRQGVTGWARNDDVDSLQAWVEQAAARNRSILEPRPSERLGPPAETELDLAGSILQALPHDYLVVDRTGVFLSQFGTGHLRDLPNRSTQAAQDPAATTTDPASLIGRNMSEVMPECLLEPCLALGIRAWELGSPQTQTVALPDDSSERRLQVIAVPLDHERLLVELQDVTLQWNDRQQLSWHRQLMRLVGSMTNTGYFEWDRMRDRVWMSPSLADLLGLEEAPINLTFQEAARRFAAPNQTHAMFNQLRRIVENGSRIVYQLRIHRVDGQERVGWVVCEPQRDESGEVTGFVGAIHDVTDEAALLEQLRQRELELTEVDRMSSMGLLASQIAHQLNQPLFSITNYAEASRLQLQSIPNTGMTEKIDQWLNRISDQARSTGESLRRMTRWLQKRAPEPRPNDLIETVHEALSLQESELEQSTITLETRFPAVPCVANFDRILMRQLITNLMQNAIEAIVGSDATERRISVAVDTADDAFEITIEDSGPGIDPRNFPRFCQPFVTTHADSLGVGLSIAKAICETFGGRLWAETADRGAKIRIRIPVDYAAPTSPKRPVDQEAPTETELPPSATP